AAVDLDVASNLAALFDHQLAVADLARDFAGRVNHEFFAYGQVAIEFATDFGDVDFCRTLECADLGDLDHARIHRCFDPAFDHQRVAIGNFNAFQLDVGTDDQLAADFVGAGCRGCRLLHGLAGGARSQRRLAADDA